VILSGIEDGILPSTHSIYDNERLEEERRLLYVGITRAKERLLLTYARSRYSFGQITDQRPSRFIDEIPLALVKFTNCDKWPKYQLELHFREWLL
jgi:DNA helicase-2/ATP-dependent DNA helicase PcrA